MADYKKRFENLIEHSHEAICIQSGWKPLYINKSFTALFGYNIDDTFAQDSLEFLVHPEDLDKIQAIRRGKEKHSCTINNFECRHITKNGKVIWVQYVMQDLIWDEQDATQITFLDITEKKVLEEQLKETAKKKAFEAWEQKEMFRIIADNVPVGLWRTDTEGNLIYANKAFEEIFGREFKELEGDKFYEYVENKDKNSCFVKKKRTKKAEELIIIQPSGNKKCVELVCSPLKDLNFHGVVGTLRDKTAEKQILPQLLQLRDELKEERTYN